MLYVGTIVSLLALFLVSGCSSSGETRQARSAARIRNRSAFLLEHAPRKALLDTLVAQHIDRTDAGDEQLLDGDLAFSGIERILESAEPALTAIRTKQLVVSSSRRRLTMWDAVTGQAIANIAVASPIVRFAGFSDTSTVASVDAQGLVSLWSFENPRSPVQFPILKLPERGAQILALGFTDEASVLDAITRNGTVYELDVASRRLLSAHSLQAIIGMHRRPRSQMELTAATILAEPYSPSASIFVAVRGEGVVRVDVATHHSSIVVPSGEIPGTPTAVVEVDLKEPEILVGTSEGTFQWTLKTHTPDAEFNGPNAGILFSENVVTLGDSQGITAASPVATDDELVIGGYHGPPVQALADGPGGTLAIGADGSVELLEREHTGLNLPMSSEERSTVADFGPEGNLLETVGLNANDIEDLIAVAPGTAHAEPGLITPNRIVRTYKPSPQWWTPGQTSPHGWFVDAAELGSRYVVAGGQDPTGTAVVLVWDAKNGKPLERLPLTESGVNPEADNTTSPPSVVSQVVLLPHRHLLAAYSALQELVAIWSTDTWQRVATIAVGPLDDFSVNPEESQLLLLSPSDGQSGLHAGNTSTQLLFASLPSGKIEQHVRDEGAELAGFAPNGTITQVTKGGAIDQLSADGRHRIGAKIELEASTTPRTIAWSPGGRQIAVGLPQGVLLVNLTTGKVSDPLPSPTGAEPVDITFSPNGQLLAASNAIPVEDKYSEQATPSIWTIGERQLATRACQVAQMDSWFEWHALATGEPYSTVCRSPADTSRLPGSPSTDALATHRLQVVYTYGESIGATASDGATFTLGSIEEDAEPQFAWSSTGGLAWVQDGTLHTVPPESSMRSAPCPCSGVAFVGNNLVAVDANSQALTVFRAGSLRPERIGLTGVRIKYPTLVASAGGRAIVAGYENQPEGNTPSSLFLLDMSGRVQRLRTKVGGSIYRMGVVSPSGRDVAIQVSDDDGMCSPEHLDVLDVADGRLAELEMPHRVQDPTVRSLTWPSAGQLEVVLAPQGCADPAASKYAPEGTAYTVEHGRLVDPRPAGYDTQHGTGVRATIVGPIKQSESAGTLAIALPEKAHATVHHVNSFLVRP